MHLVGYLYEDYHNAWSLEHEVGTMLFILHSPAEAYKKASG
jgi:hypothetical protein